MVSLALLCRVYEYASTHVGDAAKAVAGAAGGVEDLVPLGPAMVGSEWRSPGEVALPTPVLLVAFLFLLFSALSALRLLCAWLLNQSLVVPLDTCGPGDKLDSLLLVRQIGDALWGSRWRAISTRTGLPLRRRLQRVVDTR